MTGTMKIFEDTIQKHTNFEDTFLITHTKPKENSLLAKERNYFLFFHDKNFDFWDFPTQKHNPGRLYVI